VAPVWRSYLDEWDRSLRAANRPWSTRSNYQLAVTQLATFLASASDGSSDAAEDPTDVRRADVERFLAWMIETRSASTALNKYKGLQQFFRYLVEDEEMTRHPMDRIRQPTQPEKLVPVVADDELSALLATCAGKSFADRGHGDHPAVAGHRRPALGDHPARSGSRGSAPGLGLGARQG
jgi:site-specific recombinase XerD